MAMIGHAFRSTKGAVVKSACLFSISDIHGPCKYSFLWNTSQSGCFYRLVVVLVVVVVVVNV